MTEQATKLVITNTSRFDQQMLDELREIKSGAGGHGILERVIDIYLSDSPKAVTELKSAIAINDSITIHRTAHSLKSMSSQLGLSALAELCYYLETRANSTPDLDVQEKLAELDLEYRAAVVFLQSIKNQKE